MRIRTSALLSGSSGWAGGVPVLVHVLGLRWSGTTLVVRHPSVDPSSAIPGYFGLWNILIVTRNFSAGATLPVNPDTGVITAHYVPAVECSVGDVPALRWAF